MNYNYDGKPFLEVMSSRYLADAPVLRRINKSFIKTIAQYEDTEGKPFVSIWIDGESFYFHGTMEEFDKNVKTVYV